MFAGMLLPVSLLTPVPLPGPNPATSSASANRKRSSRLKLDEQSGLPASEQLCSQAAAVPEERQFVDHVADKHMPAIIV